MTAYDAIDALNWSTLREMRVSPLHFLSRSKVRRADSDTFRLGRATHTCTLEPDRFALDYAVWSDGRRGTKKHKAFVDANAGRTVLTLEQYETACRIRDAVRSHPLVQPYLADGKPEQVLEWEDRKTGLACKARLDWLGSGPDVLVVLDLKTSRYAVDERQFASSAYRLGYFSQLAHYVDGACTVLGKAPQSIPAVIVAVEPSVPFDVAVYKLTEDALWAATEERDELMATLVRCRAEAKWPGKHTAPVDLDLPRWAMPSAEDLEVGEEPTWMQGAE